MQKKRIQNLFNLQSSVFKNSIQSDFQTQGAPIRRIIIQKELDQMVSLNNQSKDRKIQEFAILKNNKFTSSDPYIKKFAKFDNQLFYNPIQTNMNSTQTQIKKKQKTQINEEKQKKEYVDLEFRTEPDQNTQLQAVTAKTLIGITKKNQIKNNRMPKKEKRQFKRIINYRSISPKLNIMQNQYSLSHFLNQKSLTITSALAHQNLRGLIKTINEFKQVIDKHGKQQQNFTKMNVQTQRSVNMKFQQTNKILQVMFQRLYEKVGSELAKINYKINSNQEIQLLISKNESEAIKYNTKHYNYLTKQLIRLIEGYFIIDKVVDKEINQKYCQQFIKYTMKIRYNLNILTRQYKYCEIRDTRNTEKENIKKPKSSFQMIRAFIKNRQATQRRKKMNASVVVDTTKQL